MSTFRDTEGAAEGAEPLGTIRAWWEHWADWIIARSDGERKAPARLGNRQHKPIEAAPGSYVRV